MEKEIKQMIIAAMAEIASGNLSPIERRDAKRNLKYLRRQLKKK